MEVVIGVVSFLSGVLTTVVALVIYASKKKNQLVGDLPDPDEIEEQEILDDR